jgi:hypothetical protein
MRPSRRSGQALVVPRRSLTSISPAISRSSPIASHTCRRLDAEALGALVAVEPEPHLESELDAAERRPA